MGNLDCLNEVDLYCLYFVFLPRINSALKGFVESWNNQTEIKKQNKTGDLLSQFWPSIFDLFNDFLENMVFLCCFSYFLS